AALDNAFSADTTTVLDVEVDANGPLIPSHTDPNTWKRFSRALLKGDPEQSGMNRQIFRESMQVGMSYPNRELHNTMTPSSDRLMKYITQTPSYLPNQRVKLLSSGQSYFKLLIQLIDQATQCIHLQVYIYEPDDTGQEVADALIRAAKRGVKIYVLVDGYGSQ